MTPYEHVCQFAFEKIRLRLGKHLLLSSHCPIYPVQFRWQQPKPNYIYRTWSFETSQHCIVALLGCHKTLFLCFSTQQSPHQSARKKCYIFNATVFLAKTVHAFMLPRVTHRTLCTECDMKSSEWATVVNIEWTLPSWSWPPEHRFLHL